MQEWKRMNAATTPPLSRNSARWPGREMPSAQHSLGRMYLTGLGVPPNHAEAAAWFRRAAEQGDADAQLNLGIMYLVGRGGVGSGYV